MDSMIGARIEGVPEECPEGVGSGAQLGARGLSGDALQAARGESGGCTHARR